MSRNELTSKEMLSSREGCILGFGMLTEWSRSDTGLTTGNVESAEVEARGTWAVRVTTPTRTFGESFDPQVVLLVLPWSIIQPLVHGINKEEFSDSGS